MADNVTTDELQQALQNLATILGTSTKEYVEGQGFAKDADLQAAVANLQSQITAITELDENDGAVSLAEKIKQIEAVLSNDEGVVQAIYSLIQQNQAAINDEVTRATGVEADLQSQITATANKANSNETAISANASEIAGVKGRMDAAEATLTTLTGDETVTGSIKKQVADEAARTNAAIATAKQEAIDTSKAYTDTEVASAKSDLQAQIDQITGGAEGSISELNGRVTALENDMNDTTDADGNLVKGVKTRLSDVEARAEEVLVEAKAYTDAHVLKASSMDICGIGNKFRQALGLADATCGGGEGGDGAVI